ncbi:vesicle transport protein SFT2C [Menidia menidia]
MADLNRQLQEYLSRPKDSGSQSGSVSLDLGAPDPVPGSWFGRWSSPWAAAPAGGGPAGGPGGSPGLSWASWSEPDPCLPGLGRRQRLLAAGLLAGMAALCFGLAALCAPLLLLYARKFALLWSLGSGFAVAAAAVLRGPGRFLAGLPRSPGAAAYLCLLGGTLYAALGLRSAALTALGAGLQGAVLLGGLLALLPGGAAGLRLLGGLLGAAVRRAVGGKSMPI